MAMRLLVEALPDFANRELLWITKAILRPWFHLEADGQVLGTLRWERPFRSGARGETAAGSWQFQRAGFFPTRFAAKRKGTELAVAQMDVAFAATRGVLVLNGGRRYSWDGKTWRPGWQWIASDGTPLVRLWKAPGRAGPALTMILPEAIGSPELSLLVLLQWYVVFELGVLAAGV